MPAFVDRNVQSTMMIAMEMPTDLDCFFDDESDIESDTNPDDKTWDSRDLNLEFSEELTVQDPGTSTSGPLLTSSVKKQLNKSERRRLMDKVRQTSVNQLLADAMTQLEKQLHSTTFEERGRTLSKSTEDCFAVL